MIDPASRVANREAVFVSMTKWEERAAKGSGYHGVCDSVECSVTIHDKNVTFRGVILGPWR